LNDQEDDEEGGAGLAVVGKNIHANIVSVQEYIGEEVRKEIFKAD